MVGAISNPAANFSISAFNRTFNQTVNLAQQLSSGIAVNSAADNAAALSVGSRLLSEGNAFSAVQSNIGQAQSILRTADGGLAEIDNLISRNNTLAVQASSDNISDFERGLLDREYQSNLAEINRISEDLRFNGQQLISGTTSEGFDFRAGTGVNPTEDTIGATINPASTDALGLTGTSIDTVANAETAITALGDARELNVENRTTVGALDSRLEIADRFVTTQADAYSEAAAGQLATNVPQAISAFQNTLNLTQQQIAVTALNNEQQGFFLRLLA